MKCPSCGGAELVRDTRDLPYSYKGQQGLVQQITGDFCPACGEVILDAAQGDRFSTWIGAFQKQVNEQHFDPSEIARVRKKLALDQRQAAELLGGGVNAFSRYETGKTTPPLALLQLLKVLDRHPELLAEIQST